MKPLIDRDNSYSTNQCLAICLLHQQNGEELIDMLVCRSNKEKGLDGEGGCTRLEGPMW